MIFSESPLVADSVVASLPETSSVGSMTGEGAYFATAPLTQALPADFSHAVQNGDLDCLLRAHLKPGYGDPDDPPRSGPVPRRRSPAPHSGHDGSCRSGALAAQGKRLVCGRNCRRIYRSLWPATYPPMKNSRTSFSFNNPEKSPTLSGSCVFYVSLK